MRIEKTIMAWLRSQSFHITRRARRNVAVSAAVFFLILFADSILPWLGHGAHLLIETVELALEHLLETALGLSPRGAQVVIAWTGLAVVIYFSVRLIRKAHGYYTVASAKLLLRWAEMRMRLTGSAFLSLWWKPAAMFLVFGFALYLFS